MYTSISWQVKTQSKIRQNIKEYVNEQLKNSLLTLTVNLWICVAKIRIIPNMSYWHPCFFVVQCQYVLRVLILLVYVLMIV